MSEPKKRYQNLEEIEAVVSGFEECSTQPSQFDHCAHVTVAFAYLHLFLLSVPEATVRMREGLYRFLDHHGPNREKYNESITAFWIKLVQGFLDRLDTSRPSTELANEIVEACGNSSVIFEYYSKDCLASEGARSGWLEPDLRSLEF